MAFPGNAQVNGEAAREMGRNSGSARPILLVLPTKPLAVLAVCRLQHNSVMIEGSESAELTGAARVLLQLFY